MPAVSSLPVFVAASVVLLVIPGPAVLYILARSGAQGRRAGLVTVVGVHAASVVHVLAAVAGLSTIVLASATAFTAVKVAGGVYLIFLGLKCWSSARRDDAPPTPNARPTNRLFAEGFVVNLFNPKVALFFLAFLPQFVERERGPIWAQTLVLGLVYISLGLVTDSAYAIGGARLGRWFSERGTPLRAGRFAEGGLLVGLGVLTLAIPARRVSSR